MSEYCCRIEKAQNGYEVELRDPKIVAQNAKSKGAWKDPNISYVFTDMEKMLEFLKNTLPTALQGDEFSSAYDKALSTPEED